MRFFFRPSSTNPRNNKPPKRYWNASEPFINFRLSNLVESALAAILVAIGYGQYIIYSKQATIQATQADISNKQFLLSAAVQRPWISIVDFVPGGAISLTAPNEFRVVFRLKNVGQLPATNVWIDGEIHTYSSLDSAISDIVSVGKAFCANLRKNRSGPVRAEGVTIMPSSEPVQRIVFMAVVTDEIIKFNFPHIANGIRIANQLNATGCVDYVSPSDNAHHQTPFEFEIDKRGPRGEFVAINPGEVIPGELLNLGVHPSLQWDAD